MNKQDEEKRFLELFYNLHKDPLLLSIFQKYGIGAFRRSSVLMNFEKFLEKTNFHGQRCVEIGTLNGLTALVLARRFKEVVSIDNTPTELKHEILAFSGLKNIRFIDCKDNEEKAAIINELDFDAAYSDADHAHDTQFDFDLVKRCGRVLFEEYWPEQPAVWNLVKELNRSGDVVSDWKFALWTIRNMDGFISRFRKEIDDDLIQCPDNGVAYQRDMSKRLAYDEKYFYNYVSREGTSIAKALTYGRAALVDKYLPGGRVLDVGVGSGEFIKKRQNTFGYDVNHKAIRWLKYHNHWSDEFESFNGFTFWDVIEHVCDPNEYFKKIPYGSYVFTSLPIFKELKKVRSSKHFKPGEHLYYWTEKGFIDWMRLYGFSLLETSSFETDAGREGITSFAFKKNLITK